MIIWNSMSQEDINNNTKYRVESIKRLSDELWHVIGKSYELRQQHAQAIREELANDDLDRAVSDVYYHQLMHTLERIAHLEATLAKYRDNQALIDHYGKAIHDVLRAVLPDVTGVSKLVKVPRREWAYPTPPKIPVKFTALPPEPLILSANIDYVEVRFHELRVLNQRCFVDYNESIDTVFVLDRKANE